MARQRLLQRLNELGLAPLVVPYPEHQTVEEGKRLRGEMAGTFTKNLLLKDKKGRLFLVTAHEDANVDLKSLHKRIGANGQLRFAARDDVRLLLGIEPGSVTPLALINDADGVVTVVIDAGLMVAEQLNFHPMVQTESVGIRPQDLLAFLRSCGSHALVVHIGSDQDSQRA